MRVARVVEAFGWDTMKAHCRIGKARLKKPGRDYFANYVAHASPLVAYSLDRLPGAPRQNSSDWVIVR